MNQMAGKQSVRFREPVRINSHACTGGSKEGEGPLGKSIDLIVEDPLFGQDNWEESESQFIRSACEIALKKAGRKKEDVRMAFSGDLLGQLIASSFGIKQLNIPYYGVYGACSSAGVTLSMAAMAVNGGLPIWRWRPVPAILPAQRKSSGSRWDMEISAPTAPRGR